MSEILFLLTLESHILAQWRDFSFTNSASPEKMFLTLSSKVSTKRTWEIENIYTAVKW